MSLSPEPLSPETLSPETLSPETAPSADAGGLDIAVGRDEAGHWVASEAHGLAGGYFTSRQDALRFAAGLLLTHQGRIAVGAAPISAFARRG